MVELMNRRKGGMSVKVYSLKFTNLSKYAPTIVANPRARIKNIVIVVFNLVEKECRSTILLLDTDIS